MTRRSYSTVDPATGRIDWVDPPTTSTAVKRIRSRLESDDEVRARLSQARQQSNPWLPRGTFRSSRGRALDDLLKIYGLTPRRYIDEVQK